MRGHFSLTKLSAQQNTVLVLFSTLFTVNIATSNVSLYVLLGTAMLLLGFC